MSKEITLEVNRLTIVKSKKLLIKELSFEVRKGEIFGFLGPNGAGKTTTIKAIVGLSSINEGDIKINGFNLKEDFKKAISNVGAVVENPEMYEFLSGYDNLLHFSRMLEGVNKERLHEVAKLVSLENRLDEKVKTYSLGMKQRLGLAQALIHSPSLLILDEPTNGLDPAGIRELRDHLRYLAYTEGVSIIISSHLLSEMEMICDRVGIVNDGKLIKIEDVEKNDHDGKHQTLFEIDNKSKVISLLKEKNYQVENGKEENQILINVNKDEIPVLNKLITENNISVYQIKTIFSSLEDDFIETTNESE